MEGWISPGRGGVDLRSGGAQTHGGVVRDPRRGGENTHGGAKKNPLRGWIGQRGAENTHKEREWLRESFFVRLLYSNKAFK